MPVLLLLALILSPGSHAAVGQGILVHFHDGGSLEGILIEENDETWTLEVPGGEISFSRASIASAEPRRTYLEEYQVRLLAAGSDPKALKDLARWSRGKGLHTLDRRLRKEVGLPFDETPAAPQEPAPAPAAGAAATAQAVAVSSVVVNITLPPAQTAPATAAPCPTHGFCLPQGGAASITVIQQQPLSRKNIEHARDRLRRDMKARKTAQRGRAGHDAVLRSQAALQDGFDQQTLDLLEGLLENLSQP